MRIGIITFWNSDDNYGQLLQAYALQQFLNEEGHDAYVIRYLPEKSGLNVSKFHPGHIIKYIKYRVGSRFDSTKGIKRDFDGFKKKIRYSEKKYVGFKELAAESWKDTDAFICGSDQIWSPKPDAQLKAYFACFAPFQAKRIAYAPSFGSPTLDDAYLEKLSGLLNGFDEIGLREDTGVKIVNQIGREAQLVCDPTILLSSEEYISRFSLKKTEDLRTMFCYFLSWEMDSIENDVSSFCKINKITPIVFSTKDYKSEELPLNEIQSPETWLQSLYNAEYSVINSFHGLVFSIILKKNFAVSLLKGKSAAMNTRITSLLEMLGLSDRIISEERPLSAILKEDIKWDEVLNKLNPFIEQSKTFIIKALNDR